MKLVLATLVLVAASVGFSETTKTTIKTVKTTETVSANSSTASIYPVAATTQPAAVHFMTNLAGLVDSKANVQVNFFGMPQLALSIMFLNSAEKTSPIKKETASIDITVTKTQYGAGAAYYINPTSQKINFIVNPFILTEKRTDIIDVENNLGFGVSALAMYRVNNFTLNLGGQTTFVAGDNLGTINAGVGYLF